MLMCDTFSHPTFDTRSCVCLPVVKNKNTANITAIEDLFNWINGIAYLFTYKRSFSKDITHLQSHVLKTERLKPFYEQIDENQSSSQNKIAEMEGRN